ARQRPLTGLILAATDFSDPALPALRAAVDEAARIGGRLAVVHCIDVTQHDWIAGSMSGIPGVAFAEATMLEARRAAQARIAEALALVGGSGEAVSVIGAAALSIVGVAEEMRAELVVVGTS